MQLDAPSVAVVAGVVGLCVARVRLNVSLRIDQHFQVQNPGKVFWGLSSLWCCLHERWCPPGYDDVWGARTGDLQVGLELRLGIKARIRVKT